MILRDNIPIHEQIKEDILSKIENNVYSCGQRLPSERRLSEDYKVSRVTIRQAISNLVSEGILERRIGSGTYVKQPVISQPMANLCGIVDELSQQNIFVNIQVLEFSRIVYDERDAHIWKRLQRPAAEGIYKIKRVLSTDDRPLLLDYNYFPDEIGVKYKNFDINQNIILTGLDTLGYHVDFAKQNISAKAATNSQAKALQIPPRAPLLEVERISYSKSDVPLLYTRAVFAGERYAYSVILKR